MRLSLTLAGLSSVAFANVLPRVPVGTTTPAVAVTTKAATSPAATTSLPAATTAGPAVVTSPAAANTPNPTLSFASTNPTAVPLASITESVATQATVALYANLVATPGATPPISGAPPLPSWAFTAGTFPALDLVPDVNSPQVSAWMQEVANSGITIPNYAPTIDAAACASNSQAAADQSRCWWTCGQCTRSTDITTCPDKLTWGLSYDDGPSPYTPDILNFMSDKQLKSTFFIVGSRAISRPDILQAEYMAGHQLSVHTWSHPPLTTLSNAQIVAELGWTREAIRQITGVSPNTMRPPYGDIDDRVRAIAMAMGMTPIIWTSVGNTEFDTNDWHIPSGQSVYSVVQTFDQILDTAATLPTGFIVLAHDLYQQTVDLAVGYILPDALARRNPQFNLMSIIECQHKPLGDAYVETNNNQTNPFSGNAGAATGSAAVAATAGGGGGAAATPAATTTAKSSGAGKLELGAAALIMGLLGAVVLA